VYLKALAIWLIFITAESMNGFLRETLLVPLWGGLRAHQVSFVIGSTLILAIATLLIPWLRISRLSQLFGVGSLWMVLTVGFEIVLGRLLIGYSWQRILADYNLLEGRLMLLGLILLIFAPLIATRLRKIQIPLARGGASSH
jgi:hypothetical protein